MDIILKQDVENLGFEFEIVSVKPGYARNYLIPQGKAVIATPKQREALNAILETRKAEEASLIAAANEKSAKLNDLEIKLEAKVGSGDRLFGSINNGDLADALVKAGVDIEKKNIKIPGNTIKRLGKSVAKIRFHREVEVDFEFEVVADQESIQRMEAAAKAKAEVARMDAERLANANKGEDSSFFNYDNPLFEKKPVIKEEETTSETPTQEEA